MLRHILRDLEWRIILAIATLILFLIIAHLTIAPAIATITETDIAPGQLHCRSERVLTDEMGNKWQVMLFTYISSPEAGSLNLRLSELSSSANLQSQIPLVIDLAADNSNTAIEQRYTVNNVFPEAPLPSIGQYDLKNVFPKLPISELILEIPLEHNTSSLHIPKALVKEWHEVAAKNLKIFKQLPSGFQLAC